MEAVRHQNTLPSKLPLSLEEEQQQRAASLLHRSRKAQVVPEAEMHIPVTATAATATAVAAASPPSKDETVIIQSPTRKSLSVHVASTIHYLANEVSARSGSPRSNSNDSRTSCTSSQTSEPPLTHARPPASPEEVDEQLDRILYAIHQLQQLQRRRRYIAAREVRSLRRAFLFAVGEEQLYREAVRAEEEGKSVTSTAFSAPSTPHPKMKKASHGPSSSLLKSCIIDASTAAPAKGEEGTPVRLPDAPSQHDNKKYNMAVDGGEKKQKEEKTEPQVSPHASMHDVTAPAWLTQANSSAGKNSPPPLVQQQQRRGSRRTSVEYSPKAAAADRLLTALEHYVEETPTSFSFDVNGARFSWRSIIHTPGERRLQSLVMSLFTFFTGIPICLAISFLLLLSRYTAPLMLLYIIWIGTFGAPVYPQQKNLAFTRFFLWKYYRDYFPVRLVVPKSVRRKVDKERNYFFVYHPHGIHTFGALLNFGLDTNDLYEMLPGITVHLQTLKANWFVPFWRHLTIWMGCGDSSASCIRKTLRSGPGQSIMLVVGGAEESLMTKPNANDLLLLKRKGFIKIALQEGTPLVPVYGFGENNVYNVADFAKEPEVQYLQGLSQRYLGFSIPLVKGRGFFNFNFGVLPHRRPIVVVMGDPIEVPRIAAPTSEDLDKWQAKYIDGLQKLYNEHRGIYDLEATGLRIMR